MRPFSLLFLVALAGVPAAGVPAAGDPALPDSEVKRLLLPAASVLAGARDAAAGHLLLHEEVIWVGDDGRQVRILHDVLRADNPQGYVENVQRVDEVPAIAGELTALLSWDGEGADTLRYSVELPVVLARRLREVVAGELSAAVEPAPPARKHLVWTARGGDEREGPAVRLSTVASWEVIADYFRELFAPPAALDLELDDEAAIWTAGAVDRAEVLAILEDRVLGAVEVVSGGLPRRGAPGRTPGEVWRERRGTAAEVTRLLLVLLRRQGVPSAPAFVATTPSGVIETRTPGPEQVDHVLLTVDDGSGVLRWRDLGTGLPTDARRDALLVHDGGYRFLRTPSSVLDFLVSPRQRLAALYDRGRLAEDAGQDEAALAAFEGLRGLRELDGLAYEGLYRAAVLHLRAGQVDAALELATILGEQDDDERSSPLAVAMAEHASLAAEPLWTRRYWKAHEAWWPAWQALEERLGVSGGAPPIRPQGEVLDEVRAAVQASDFAGLAAGWRWLVHAARWRPSLITEVAGTAQLLARADSDPERAAAIRDFAIELLRASPFADPDRYREGEMMLTSHLLEASRPGEALEVLRLYFAAQPPDDRVRRQMAAYWEVAAAETEQGLVPLAAEPADEPEIIRVESPLPPSIAPVDPFDHAVAGWLERFAPPWLGYARPKSLDQVRGDPMEALSPGNSAWRSPEAVKIALLIASDSSRPGSERVEAFLAGLRYLRELVPRYSVTRRLLEGAVDESGLGLVARRAAHLLLLTDAFEAGDRPAFEAALDHPLLTSCDESQRRVVELYRRVLAARAGSAAEAADAALAIVREQQVRGGEGVDSVADGAFAVLFDHLLRQGELAEAGRVVQELESVSDDAGWRQRYRSRLAKAVAEQPLIDALTRVTRAELGEIPRPPDMLADLRSPESVELLSWADGRASRLVELLDPGAAGPRLPAGEWRAARWPALLFKSSEPTDDAADLAVEQVLAVLGATPNDQQRFLVLLGVREILSMDDGERFGRLFAAASGLDGRSADLLRLYREARSWRTTGEVDVDRAAAGFEAPELLRQAEWMKLARLAQWSVSSPADQKALRAFLQGIPEQRRIEPNGLADLLRAAVLANLDSAEAGAVERLRGLAAAQLYDDVLRSWARPDEARIRRVLDLAAVLGPAGPRYPDAWLGDVLAAVRNPLLEHRIRLADAEVRGNWQRVLDEARWLIDVLPDDADLHWNLGRAARELGRRELAREALTVFVERALDHPHLLAAAAWLKELEASAD